MWQFGELGYDVSIEENGRTGRKPIRWNYYEDANRRALYDALSKIISWRTSHEEIYGAETVKVHQYSVGDTNMSGKILVMDNVIVVANFTNEESTTQVNVPNAGEWTNLMTGEKVTLSASYEAVLGGGDYVVLVR
jgi:hypothetical protein